MLLKLLAFGMILCVWFGQKEVTEISFVYSFSDAALFVMKAVTALNVFYPHFIQRAIFSNRLNSVADGIQ
jgi:hypothetical protein